MEKRAKWIGWLLAAEATAMYILTMEPTVSYWDCGEFIATSYKLQIGHPPGAPFYQLIAHAFSWLAMGDATKVAYCCNLLSAVAGGLTVMLLYLIALLLQKESTGRKAVIGAAAGALCYQCCDTAWFSAVESEVYSMAMLMAALALWLTLRWYRNGESRNLLCTALVMGLGVCVHELTLLTAPAIAVLIARRMVQERRAGHSQRVLWGKVLVLSLLFFIIGLTPYLIVPIRAAAHPPINSGCPDNAERLVKYLRREQYTKAPLYPRIWKYNERTAPHIAAWSGGDTGIVGNIRYYATYQLGYMYGRYVMNNFIGRRNRSSNSNVYYIFPLFFALVGIAAMWRHNRMAFWVTGVLFITAGPILNLYLNHPCYEPRERDYVYVLSFFAIALWIASGSTHIESRRTGWMRWAGRAAIAASVVLLTTGNWSDHDRSNRQLARDTAVTLLNSCDRDAILFVYGDNDTFPLWYAQQVEGIRTDIQVENINLIGFRRFEELISQNLASRPCYLSHYAYEHYKDLFDGYQSLEGMTYRIVVTPHDTINVEAIRRHIVQGMKWHDTTGVYIDPTGRDFLRQYQKAMEAIAHPTPYLDVP